MSGLLKKVRLDVFVCVIAMAAMAVSAVSACACVHHSERAAGSGCHSASSEPASHSGNKTHSVQQQHSHHQDAASAEHNEDRFDAPCNCGNADSITAVTVRGESVRHPAAVQIAPGDVPQFEYEGRETAAAISIPAGYISLYTSLFRMRSGPSRAPPRL